MDPLMQLLLQTAIHCFGNAPRLPLSLQGYPLREATKKRADFLQLIAGLLTDVAQPILDHVPPLGQAEYTQFAGNLRAHAQLNSQLALFLDDLANNDERIHIALRLYVGYLETAKVIAWGVTNRKNTAVTRFQEIHIIETRAAGDAIYSAGVETAPQYKWRVRGEGIYTDGIPAGAIVLRDWDD
jgi:hypothetical protein